MSDKEFELKDSGQRQRFDTGAVRDIPTGKGRFDLITPFGMAVLAQAYQNKTVSTSFLCCINYAIEAITDFRITLNIASLGLAARQLCDAIHCSVTNQFPKFTPFLGYANISPIALKRLAAVYEKGASKYTDRNWEQGMPVSRTLDSAFRHITQALNKEVDEDHLAQALWNVMAAIHFIRAKPECMDLPKYLIPSDIEEPLITDNCGNFWSKKCPVCGQESMEIVRPGQVQCSNCGG